MKTGVMAMFQRDVIWTTLTSLHWQRPMEGGESVSLFGYRDCKQICVNGCCALIFVCIVFVSSVRKF